MVDSKRYDPTITRFQKHTKSFVSGKTKKGHLNDKDDEDSGNVKKEEGILVRINKQNLYGNGWEVKVDKKTLKCTYGDNIIYMPDCNLVGSYYIPKEECKVEVSIDKKTKINTITRINDPNKTPIAMTSDGIKLQANGSASLTVNNEETVVSGTNLVVDGSINVDDGEVNINGDIPVGASITNLYERIEILESQLSDKDDI